MPVRGMAVDAHVPGLVQPQHSQNAACAWHCSSIPMHFLVTTVTNNFSPIKRSAWQSPISIYYNGRWNLTVEIQFLYFGSEFFFLPFISITTEVQENSFVTSRQWHLQTYLLQFWLPTRIQNTAANSFWNPDFNLQPVYIEAHTLHATPSLA